MQLRQFKDAADFSLSPSTHHSDPSQPQNPSSHSPFKKSPGLTQFKQGKERMTMWSPNSGLLLQRVFFEAKGRSSSSLIWPCRNDRRIHLFLTFEGLHVDSPSKSSSRWATQLQAQQLPFIMLLLLHSLSLPPLLLSSSPRASSGRNQPTSCRKGKEKEERLSVLSTATGLRPRKTLRSTVLPPLN